MLRINFTLLGILIANILTAGIYASDTAQLNLPAYMATDTVTDKATDTVRDMATHTPAVSPQAVYDVGCETRCPERFRLRQIVLPAALIAVGTVGVWNASFKDLNKEVKSSMDKLRGDHYFRADDYVQYLPAAVYFGLGFTGVRTKHSFKQRLAVEITAYLAMAAITNAAKYAVRERRPDSGARNSFPSGHTATAFTGAELIREEYGPWWGTGAYVVATGVAFLRLYNGRHWLNDVIAGAGVGILSARIGYWMLPLYNKWFHWDKKPDSPVVAIAPSYNHVGRSLGMSMAIVF